MIDRPKLVRPTRCEAPGCRNPVPQAATGRIRHTCGEACKKRLQRKHDKEARKRSVEWYTPIPVFEWFSARWGPFDLDPFATPLSPVWNLVEHRITRAEDAFRTPWRGRRAFANPPFGRLPGIGRCLERGHAAVVAGEVELVAFLVPLRPSSAWSRWAKEHGAECEPYDVSRVRFLELTDDGEVQQTSGALFETTAIVFRDIAVSRNGTARVEPTIDLSPAGGDAWGSVLGPSAGPTVGASPASLSDEAPRLVGQDHPGDARRPGRELAAPTGRSS